jgi:hypothetical protein
VANVLNANAFTINTTTSNNSSGNVFVYLTQ